MNNKTNNSLSNSKLDKKSNFPLIQIQWDLSITTKHLNKLMPKFLDRVVSLYLLVLQELK